MVRVVESMPFEAYQQEPGINATLLKIVHSRSMLHAKAAMEGRLDTESDAKDFGKCFHAYALEGKTEWVTQPDTYPAPKTHARVKKKEIEEGHPLKWNANAGYCKEWLESQDKTVLKPSAAHAIVGMTNALRADALLGPMLEKAKKEVSVFAPDKKGMALKVRVDALPDDDNSPVVDLKSTTSANPEIFLSQCLSLGYDIQCAHTLDVLRYAQIPRRSMWLVGIESEYPYAYCVLKFDDTAGTFLRVGRIKAQAARFKLAAAMKSGKWPGYESGPAEHFAKDYHRKELDQTL